jgi:hypothetical protein
VTGRGVPHGDMPIFPWPGRGGVPPVGDPVFDALLTGNLLPDEAPAGLRPVAEAIAALNEAPASSEMAAEASALAVYSRTVRRPAEPIRPRRTGRPSRTPRLRARLAAAAAVAAAGAVTLGGAAAAAYAGALPASVQKLAHDFIGAPAVHQHAPATPVEPQATAKDGYGLCNAYARLKEHGDARQKTAAFHDLATAAGGAANVTAYCATVAHPGATTSGESASDPHGKSAGHPHGKPATHPTGKPTNHPTGKPTMHPTGKHTNHPTGTS